ncbi:MAG TPA: type III polyketide synthase [Ktedonobacterales bacterium]
MPKRPRILSLATALAPHKYEQRDMLTAAREYLLGSDWAERPDAAERAHLIERLFIGSQVQRRQSVVDLRAFYARPRSTGERMAAYQPAAYQLSRAAMEQCLAHSDRRGAGDITDFLSVSCTGYGAPGLDIELARDLGLPRQVRRVAIGHMGCFGALVGLRQALAIVQAQPTATAALLSVELPSLHFAASLDAEILTSFALFGDAAAALLVGMEDAGAGPEIVTSYCAADFESANQMSWTIGDQGFVMGLSPRVPVTLRRNIVGVIAQLLAPLGLSSHEITHWIIHPGGPSILDAIQGKLELTDDQMRHSWQVLREHGNCSSATVLLILDRLLRSGQTRAGEWGVMMAFGPGLTLETCLLRF